MGHGHSHRAGHDDDVEVAAVPRTVLLSFLAAALVVTIVGLVTLWPDGDEVDELRGSVSFAGEGVTFPEATVEEVAPACDVPDRAQRTAAGRSRSRSPRARTRGPWPRSRFRRR